MGVVVYNISSASARVSWPPSPTCLDTFYSVMYDPDWNGLLMGYKRKRFKQEDRIPVSQTSARLLNLLPQTAYFVCVTCQAADPVREQCQAFSTLSESSEGRGGARWELTAGVWLAGCLLLLLVAGALLWGCLRRGRAEEEDGPAGGKSACGDGMGCGSLFAARSGSDLSLGSVGQRGLAPAHSAGRIIAPGHES
ncbi:unnamed protein product [Menidia menidia]|uniref:(Atlantic silverside) hypothetical protein n=1 Tax=Menidia menidia TaxID=238744 RepID=A0A8S4ACJ2_9TELE|nr:unnamed protein product [Menidia menidia]